MLGRGSAGLNTIGILTQDYEIEGGGPDYFDRLRSSDLEKSGRILISRCRASPDDPPNGMVRSCFYLAKKQC